MAIATEPSFFTVLWNQKFLVIGIVAVAAAIGFGLTAMQPATYEAEATARILDPNTAQELTDEMGLERNAGRNVKTQAAFMEMLDDNISTAIEKDTGIILIDGAAETANGAVGTIDAMFAEYSTAQQADADAAAVVLIGRIDDEQVVLEAEIVELEEEIAASDSPTPRARLGQATNKVRGLDSQRTKIENQLESYGDGVEEFIPANTPSSPSSTSPIVNAVIAAVLGVLVAVGVAWVRGSAD